MSWICPKCETENPDRLMVCEVCDSPRVVKKKTVRTISLENKDSFCDRRYNAYIRLKGMNLMVFDSDAESFDWEKICREDSIPFSNPIFISCLKREAENGNKDAQVILARCYVRGLGVKKNINDAVIWFRRAAEQGKIEAMLALGLWCRDGGDGFMQDKEEAHKWLKKAAEGGNKSAQFILEEETRKATCCESNSGCCFVLSIALLVIVIIEII